MKECSVRPGINLVKILDVYLLIADKEARNSCRYIRPVNEIGAYIWECLSDGREMEDIVCGIRSVYDIPDSYDLEKDVRSFLTELSEEQYVMREA